MKKILLLFTIVFLAGASAAAQPGYGHYGMPQRGSRYNRGPAGGDYRRGDGRYGHYGRNWYGGIKVGLVGSHVRSGTSELDGNRLKSGISLGIATGFNIAPVVAFESGLYYVEKGGSSADSDGRFTYDLNYIEIPLLVKYYFYSGSHAVIQPFIGAYLGMGVGGTIKDYDAREAFSSYSKGYFRRPDSGLAFGCGVSWSLLYASLGYELGMANIGRDHFSDTHNRAIIFSVGLAF